MMKKVALFSLLIFALTLHAQEQNEGINVDTPDKSKTTFQSISVEGGLAWITSKVYTPDGYFKGQLGYEFGVEYTNIKTKGFGFGLSFYHNETSIHGYNAKLNYIGPSLIYSYLFHPRFLGKISLGMGIGTALGKDNSYGHYVMNDNNVQFGLGARLAVGVNYLAPKHFGIGINLQDMAIFLGKKSNPFGGSDEINGIERIGVLFGFHYYF